MNWCWFGTVTLLYHKYVFQDIKREGSRSKDSRQGGERERERESYSNIPELSSKKEHPPPQPTILTFHPKPVVPFLLQHSAT